MSSPEEFRERAAECDKLAAEATNPHAREVLYDAAQRWRFIANEIEAKTQSNLPVDQQGNGAGSLQKRNKQDPLRPHFCDVQKSVTLTGENESAPGFGAACQP
jgi:hypothetical protein